MDCIKTGRLISQLRRENGLTQQMLADKLRISNKTVSKWECGMGCPDVSLLNELAEVLGTKTSVLLSGTLPRKSADSGKINKMGLYICPVCRNIITSTSNADISCCGKKLDKLEINTDNCGHEANISFIDGDYFISMEHDMSKEHHIAFAMCVQDNKSYFERLYPESSAEFRMPSDSRGGILYIYCTNHGLFRYDMPF